MIWGLGLVQGLGSKERKTSARVLDGLYCTATQFFFKGVAPFFCLQRCGFAQLWSSNASNAVSYSICWFWNVLKRCKLQRFLVLDRFTCCKLQRLLVLERLKMLQVTAVAGVGTAQTRQITAFAGFGTLQTP